jgi:hypothetical protein
LGPDILTNPLVTNSKITENEMLSLEDDISLLELDRSIMRLKKTQQGGWMGLAMPSLKNFGLFSEPHFTTMRSAVLKKGT